MHSDATGRDKCLRYRIYVAVQVWLEFRSTGLRARGAGEYALDGEMTVHGVTRPVTFQVELNGFTKDPYGGYRTGLSATTDISRSDFGVSINLPMKRGGVVVGDRLRVRLELEAVFDAPAC